MQDRSPTRASGNVYSNRCNKDTLIGPLPEPEGSSDAAVDRAVRNAERSRWDDLALLLEVAATEAIR